MTRDGRVTALTRRQPHRPGASIMTWIPWNGGECPVPPETLVYARFGDNYELSRPYRAGSLRWSHNPESHGGQFDIIAYRIVEDD